MRDRINQLNSDAKDESQVYLRYKRYKKSVVIRSSMEVKL